MKFLVTYFVSFLVFTILVCILLYGLVCKMDKLVGVSFEREGDWRGADVSLGKPVGFKNAIDWGKKEKMSDIELSIFE